MPTLILPNGQEKYVGMEVSGKSELRMHYRSQKSAPVPVADILKEATIDGGIYGIDRLSVTAFSIT